jgi:type IV pilus assembly protein PilW
MDTTDHIKAIKNGFTIVELLIAMAITGIVSAAIYTAFQSQQQSYLSQDQIVEMQQNLRAAMDIMVREIRMAGYDPYGNSDAGITSATGNKFGFKFVADDDSYDNDDDETTDEMGELKTLEYDLYDAYSDGDNDIGRKVGEKKRAAAENIEEIEFYYTLADSTKTTTPADPSQIRSLQITILARTGDPVRGFTDTKTYNTPSGASWGPYNDNYRRRLLTTTVKCRNMGLN